MVYMHYVEKNIINRKIKYLILGDSRPASAINDSLINQAFNACMESESYFFTFYKLNHYLSNRNIKYIILGISYDNLTTTYESKENNLYIQEYAALLELSGHIHLIRTYPITYLEIVRKSFNIKHHFKNVLYEPDKNKFSFERGYYSGNKTNTSDSAVNSAIKRHFYNKDGNINPFSVVQIYYLQKIVDVCNEKGIKLLLVMTPLHRDYREKVPPLYLAKMDSLKLKYKNNFLDYSDFKLEDYQYGDGDHINYYGSKVFTQKLIDTLRYFDSLKPNE